MTEDSNLRKRRCLRFANLNTYLCLSGEEEREEKPHEGGLGEKEENERKSKT
jgi:hypothetical protein